MKMKIILFALVLFCLGACDESKYELENIVPEEYHQVMYINNSGTHELTLSMEKKDTFELSIYKGGSNPNLTASINIGILSQEVVDSTYSNVEKVNYQVMDEECYSLEVSRLDFLSNDRYKILKVSFDAKNLQQAITENPEVTYVLPIYMYSKIDSVNVDKDKVFLKIKYIVSGN